MDEGLLNDLLECSVCLERLDTSSRVLPCQHTFCLKCLKVIVESHKELRCPECRILVETKVEELPPNVLLMRILEGMRNSAPRKLSGTQRALRTVHALASQSGQQSREGKQLPAHARAMHDYISKEPGDLSFKKGETILLQKKLDPYWYQGECSGRSGVFPITFAQVVVPLQIPTALCKALYDFRMSAPDEEGCLAFDKGAIITVHRRVDENWAEGRLEQRVGIFPIAFVELNQAARQLMNTTPLNRAVPPLPDQARAGHSEHRHHAQNSHRYQPMSTSMPTTGQGNYQNMSTMSQSHPNYQPILAQQPQILVPTVNQQVSVSHGIVTTAIPRNIVEPTQAKHSIDLIHFSNMSKGTMGLQSMSRIAENYDRIRGVKLDYNSTPSKVETTYQNVRTHEHFPVSAANFNNTVSSDSSSSMNTPSVGSTTTPNTSSNTSTCESAEPSLPSSPDNNTERNATVVTGNTTQNPEENQENNEDTSLNTSMGVLSLNESSTATNTSLNVSLPPAESPKLNTSNTSNLVQNQEESNENASNNEVGRLDVPSSSKSRSSGPDSLLNFGLGLQAVLSPSHVKDGNYMVARHRDHHKDKRHSLTPSSHLQGNHNQNRHSAEILATSLLDNTATPDRDRERRRRRERSAERTGSGAGVAVSLPAAYVAVYPYKPQKPDELELKKGGVYSVHERCRDGWYKGWCGRTQRAGVFPGNYVTPAPSAHHHHLARHAHKPTAAKGAPTAAPAPAPAQGAAPPPPPPPDAPPRAPSPPGQPLSYPWSSSQTQPQSQSQQSTPRSDKSKEKSRVEKSSISTGVSLMKRLAAMKKCKSPPPVGYSMDNPVFDDGPGTSLMLNLPSAHHPVHVRSGSCPSQLLRALPAPAPHAAATSAPHASATSAPHDRDRRHKERHDHHLAHRSNNSEGPWQSQHRKSASLDVTATATATATAARRDRDKHHSQTVKERFRCIVPYPPNSEYELELKVDDIVIVSKKRGDGWYKGTLQRTGRTGLFPASFVQSYPID